MSTPTARSIPPCLAPVIAAMELERPRLLTVQQLAILTAAAGLRTSARVIAHRLVQRGWLLPTSARSVWEFAPAERAGAYSDGDSSNPVRAVLALAPSQTIAVALGSALYLRGLADRGPDILEVALPEAQPLPRGLARTCRITRFVAHLPTETVQDVPVHRLESVLVHAAHRPRDVRSWGALMEVVAASFATVDTAALRQELVGRPRATAVRLAYLLSGVAPVVAKALMPTGTQRVWFGPRQKVRRYDAARGIADTVLPMAPTELRSP